MGHVLLLETQVLNNSNFVLQLLANDWHGYHAKDMSSVVMMAEMELAHTVGSGQAPRSLNGKKLTHRLRQKSPDSGEEGGRMRRAGTRSCPGTADARICTPCGTFRPADVCLETGSDWARRQIQDPRLDSHQVSSDPIVA